MRRSPASLLPLLLLLAAHPAQAEEWRDGGKLLLTNGITSLEGASGGGLTPWATIAGDETKDGIGVSGHITYVPVKDYHYTSGGVAIGLFDRVELSFARQHFNTENVGALLGLGKNYAFNQDVIGAKVRLVGDVVYDGVLPAIAAGVEYKHNDNGPIVHALGGRHANGADYYVSATKLFLSRSVLLNVTARLTEANQIGLLGYGGDKHGGYSLQFEASAAYQFSRRLAVGAEYRRKPNNLNVAREDDWYDIFAAYAVNRYLTATVAYTDLGSIATFPNQRGTFLSLQAAF